jgi:DNA polymerase-4
MPGADANDGIGNGEPVTAAVAAPRQRKIIHCDCDCFYAAVEMRDDPRLRDRTLAVGGRADRRGVIATCNYAARAFGVRSAMSSAHAMRLCPELLILPPDMPRYRQAATQIRSIFHEYSALVEPLSLDEAYLDVSDSPMCGGSATRIARELRARIAERVGITVSAGVAPNKFLAKIASEWRKPDGLFVITPAQVDAFVSALPVSRLHGVGHVTARRLQQLGIETCADLRQLEPLQLVRWFGKFGQRLAELARGIDERPVQPNRERKSVSVERTYVVDLPDLGACLNELPDLLQTLQERLRQALPPRPVRKLFVKVKTADFRQTTVERPGVRPELDDFQQLCRQACERHQRPVRLLGVGVRFDEDFAETQLQLFGNGATDPPGAG